MQNDNVVAALARLGERIDGMTVAMGLMRTDMRDEFRDLHERLGHHIGDDDRRFNASAVITDTKVGEVYKHIESREHNFVIRLIAIFGLILTGLGTVSTLFYYFILPALRKV